MIELKNLSKVYEKSKRTTTALADFSLSIKRGTIVGVIGSSGAGKSTLIRCINFLEKPSSGEVIIDGKNLGSLSVSELGKERRNIGMIFQHFNLLANSTVFENIAFPLKLQGAKKDVIERKVSELLTLVGLENKRNDYPASLSGGQKQRVAIARALAPDPQVLLCDEATSALDPATTRSILALIKKINLELNITVVLITHEMEVVKTICDHVAVIDKGYLVETGPVAKIFSNPESPVTRGFIEASVHVDLPIEYRSRLHTEPGENRHPLIKIELMGSSLDAGVLSEAARLYHVDNHIVIAKIDSVDGVSFGSLLVEVRGEQSQSFKALAYLKNKNIQTEILGYV